MNGVQPTQIVLMVCCDLHALEVTNLNVGANELKRTDFKGSSLWHSIIFVTVRHFMCFWSSAVSSTHKNAMNVEEDLKGAKCLIIFGSWNITYLTVETDKFRRILPRS